jgi:hypothetical protein
MKLNVTIFKLVDALWAALVEDEVEPFCTKFFSTSDEAHEWARELLRKQGLNA